MAGRQIGFKLEDFLKKKEDIDRLYSNIYNKIYLTMGDYKYIRAVDSIEISINAIDIYPR
jgi:hypothetical protein